jgi:hypothetical protein
LLTQALRDQACSCARVLGSDSCFAVTIAVVRRRGDKAVLRMDDGDAGLRLAVGDAAASSAEAQVVLRSARSGVLVCECGGAACDDACLGVGGGRGCRWIELVKWTGSEAHNLLNELSQIMWEWPYIVSECSVDGIRE